MGTIYITQLNIIYVFTVYTTSNRVFKCINFREPLVFKCINFREPFQMSLLTFSTFTHTKKVFLKYDSI